MIIIHKILAQNIIIDSVRGRMTNDYLSIIAVEFKLKYEMLISNIGFDINHFIEKSMINFFY